MRQTEEGRENEGGEVRVEWKWVPGSAFAGAESWERGCTEAKSVRVTSALFADDTTIVCKKGELQEGVREVKRVIGEWRRGKQRGEG